MKKSWQETVISIISEATELLREKKVHWGVKRIDYATIFPKSEMEHQTLIEHLSKEGKVVEFTSTGKVFKLFKKLKTPQGKVFLIRVRVFDPLKIQAGYVDYRINDYQKFKNKYLLQNTVSITHNIDGLEMLFLENEKAIIYFPEIPLSKSLKGKTHKEV